MITVYGAEFHLAVILSALGNATCTPATEMEKEQEGEEEEEEQEVMKKYL